MLSIMRATIVMVLVSAATASSGSGSGDATPADIVTSLSADVAAGATKIPLTDVDGIKVGDTFSITDGNNTESSKITAVSAGGTRQRRATGTVTVSPALTYAYAAGTVVSVTTNVDASSSFEYHDAPFFGLLVFVVLAFFFGLLTFSLVSACRKKGDVEEDAESDPNTSV